MVSRYINEKSYSMPFIIATIFVQCATQLHSHCTQLFVYTCVPGALSDRYHCWVIEKMNARETHMGFPKVIWCFLTWLALIYLQRDYHQLWGIYVRATELHFPHRSELAVTYQQRRPGIKTGLPECLGNWAVWLQEWLQVEPTPGDTLNVP